MKKQIITLLILSLMAVSLLAPTVAVAKIDETTRVIVGFKDFNGQGIIKANGWKINSEYHTIPAIACSLPAVAIELLKKSPFVSYVEEDTMVALSDPPDAELAASWGVTKIGADTVQAAGNVGQGIRVAVIDTGINYLHEDLDGNYVTGYNFVSKGATPPMDDNGHGTHCAGIIAAEDNGIAVIGVAPKASLYALKVLNSAGSGYTSDIIAAIQWACDNGIQVISMSLGSSVGSTALQQACDDAYLNHNIVVVAAAGNNGAARIGSNINYPAKYANVIAVGATDQSNLRASFSCTGPELDLMAPGVNIISDYLDVKPGDGGNVDTLYMSGTSMATPHVAGTAALIVASGEANEKAWGALGITDNDGKWSSSDVSKVLVATADDLGATGKDNYYGYGIVDADQAATPINTPPPTPSITVGSVGITAPAGSTGGTVATGEVFTISAKIHLGTGSTSVSTFLNVPSGYTITTANPAVATVSTSDASFTWTVAAPSSALASAPISVTATATGYDSGNGQFTITTVTAAKLSGSFTASATSQVNVGDTIPVTMRISNIGTASATLVSPTTLQLDGTGKASLATGPSPTSATIIGGSYQDFTWTYTATSVGTITFSGSASGTAQYSDLSIASGSVGPSSTVTINSSPPPTEKTYVPTAVALTRGTIASGSYVSLAANDGTDLLVKSARVSSSQTIDWYSSFKIEVAKAKVTTLKVTYDGSYSKTQTQILYVYNFAGSRWDQINSQNVGTTDVPFASSTLDPANYISSTGEIRLRVYATQRTSTAFNCNADYAAITITYTP